MSAGGPPPMPAEDPAPRRTLEADHERALHRIDELRAERDALLAQLGAAHHERDAVAARLDRAERAPAPRADGTTQLDVLLARVLATGAIGSFAVLVVLVLVAAL